jgi:hypothetical protein
MTCADVQRVLPEITNVGGDLEFESHLKSCPACLELVRELEWIAAEARELADTEEPPDWVWGRISNQLRAEGIIRDVEAAPVYPLLAPAPSRRWSAWWLAPVAVAILAAGSYQLAHKTTTGTSPQVAQRQAPQQPAAPSPQPTSNRQVAQQMSPSEPASAVNRPAQLAKHHAARLAAAPASTMQAEISPPASEDDQQFLSEVSQHAPTMRATYEKQLRAVNAEIRETQEYIKVHPEDLDARQHLMETYQQKALLYQMALDRIQ